MIYTAIVTFIILKVLDVVIGLRVTEEEESVGLDLAQHNERGYNLYFARKNARLAGHFLSAFCH